MPLRPRANRPSPRLATLASRAAALSVAASLALVSIACGGDPAEGEPGGACIQGSVCAYGYPCVNGVCQADSDNSYDVAAGLERLSHLDLGGGGSGGGGSNPDGSDTAAGPDPDGAEGGDAVAAGEEVTPADSDAVGSGTPGSSADAAGRSTDAAASDAAGVADGAGVTDAANGAPDEEVAPTGDAEAPTGDGGAPTGDADGA